MKSILDWENVKENEGNTPLPAGAYLCQIMGVIDIEPKSCLKINLEIIEGEFRGMFTEMAKRYDKWPYPSAFLVYVRTFGENIPGYAQGEIFPGDEEGWICKTTGDWCTECKKESEDEN